MGQVDDSLVTSEGKVIASTSPRWGAACARPREAKMTARRQQRQRGSAWQAGGRSKLTPTAAYRITTITGRLLRARLWGRRRALSLLLSLLTLPLSLPPNTTHYSHIHAQVRAHSIVIATGATAKRLNLPSENTFWGKGISACAICDGASPLFKNQEVAVVGGGDSATEEAVYLTKYCKHVSRVVQRHSLGV